MTYCVVLARALDSDPLILSTVKALSVLGLFTRSKMQSALIYLQNDVVLQRGLPDTTLHNPYHNLVEAFCMGVKAASILSAKFFARNVGSVVDKAIKLSCKQNVSEVCNNNPLFIHLLKNQYGNYYEKLN